MTTICLEDPSDVGFFANDGISRAVSDSGSVPARQLKDVEVRFLESWAGRSYSVAQRSLSCAATEALAGNWDGYGARAVDLMAVNHALRLLRHIPAGLPAPHVAIDPDGEVSFEWHREPRSVFSVSVGPDGQLSYAGLFGRSTVRGFEAYFAGDLPSEIRSGLRRVFS